jgi:hypothetical protein
MDEKVGTKAGDTRRLNQQAKRWELGAMEREDMQ